MSDSEGNYYANPKILFDLYTSSIGYSFLLDIAWLGYILTTQKDNRTGQSSVPVGPRLPPCYDSHPRGLPDRLPVNKTLQCLFQLQFQCLPPPVHKQTLASQSPLATALI